MSWVKLDDGAYEHAKLLVVGARAAWLWVCCLSYCNGQKRRDGFIPKAKIALLYPGVGMKEARLLAGSNLLEEVDGGFLIHGYHEYQPSEALSDARSMAGKQGGIKSGEARRSKNEASASSNPKPSAKQLPEAQNEAPSRPVPSDPIPTQAASVQDLKEITREEPSKIPCPADLCLTEKQAETLDTAMIPRSAQAALTARFVAKAVADPTDLRPLVTWQKCLSSAISGDWNDPKRRPKAPGEAEHEERQRADDEAFLARAKRGEYGPKIQAGASAHRPPPTTELRRMARERALSQKTKPAERETAAGAVSAFLKAKAPRAEPVIAELAPEPPPVELSDEPELPPLEEHPRAPSPAASSPGAGPRNLGGFAAGIIAERERERAEKRRKEGVG